MGVLAASNGFTWGISGPAFLAGYGLLALAVLLGIMVARQRITAGPASTAVGEVGEQPHDIAYLNGGPELAVLSALSSMRVAGTIVAAGRGRVRAEGQLAMSASELERAIHQAAITPIARDQLPTNPIALPALENTRGRLEDAGLLLSAEQRRRIKRLTLWMVAVALLGLMRLAAGVASGAAVGFLIVELLVIGIVAAVLLGNVPTCSQRGTATLKTLRAQHNELDPRMRPNWASYGPARAALGVGIFGTSAIWASDPAFAAEVNAQRAAAAAGGSDSGGGAGDSGGGGCGGGCGG